MFGLGAVLAIIGAMGLVLPMVGYNHKLINLVPEAQRPIVSGALLGVGIVLCLVAKMKGKKKEKK
jgi:hypothetical protein